MKELIHKIFELNSVNADENGATWRANFSQMGVHEHTSSVIIQSITEVND